MKEKLKKITNEEVKNIIFDKDALRHIKKTGETPFEIKGINLSGYKAPDRLIELEIAFRRCSRFGVFE